MLKDSDLSSSDTSNLSVLVLTHTYPSQTAPWVTPFVFDHTRFLAEQRNLSVTVHMPKLTDPLKSGARLSFFSVGANNRIPHKRIGGDYRRLRFSESVSYFGSALLSALRSSIESPPDIILAHWAIPSGFIGMLLSFVLRRPLIVATHGRDVMHSEDFPNYSPASGAFMRLIVRMVLRRAVVISTSETIEKSIREIEPSCKPLRIPVGLSPEWFQEMPDERREADTIVFAGDLIARKGVDLLLRAIRASQLLQSCHVKIVGEGIDAGEYRAFCEREELGRVQFVPPMSHEQLRHVFQGSAVLAFPSRIEAFGLVVIEALRCGMVVAGMPTGCLPELARDAAFTARIHVARDVNAEALQEVLECAVRTARSGLPSIPIEQFNRFHMNTVASAYRESILKTCSSLPYGPVSARAKRFQGASDCTPEERR